MTSISGIRPDVRCGDAAQLQERRRTARRRRCIDRQHRTHAPAPRAKIFPGFIGQCGSGRGFIMISVTPPSALLIVSCEMPSR